MSGLTSSRSHIAGTCDGVVDVELDEPADVHVGHALEAERRQRLLDDLALRVEDALLGPHEHADARHQPVLCSQASNGSPVSSS
jgi:hypothetical protein